MDGTTANYSPLQGWSNNKNYAFFAFYPHDLTLVNRDGSTPYSGGVPAIKYTMDAPEEYPEEGAVDGADFVKSMTDVMTAAPITDCYWKSASDYYSSAGVNTSGGEVKFSFSHRLSSMGLNVKNASAGGISVSSVTFTISGLKNQSVIFPLGGNDMDPIYDGEEIGDIACSLDMPESGAEITASDEGTELSDKLIFIPQSDAITFTITVGYTRTLEGYDDKEISYTTSPLTTSLTEGKKHLVYLKFTDSTVEIIGEVREEGWVDIPTVEDTFM